MKPASCSGETELIGPLEDGGKPAPAVTARQLVGGGERRACTTLQLDPEKIASAVGNLLSNAIRFRPNRCTVRLAVRAPGAVLIDVSDQGPAWPRQTKPMCSSPSSAVNASQKTVRGTGIGLSIVQEYIHAHGGRVHLLGEAPHSFFRIELPDAS